MQAVAVAMFVLYLAVEGRRAWRAGADDAAARMADSLEARRWAREDRRAAAAGDRARRAYAVRCSCDGRDQ